jgi:glycosyltransferase involved in cell wall biosynthesis
MVDQAINRTSSGLVSVIIPCFNGARTIRRAVDSVRRQDYPEVEIIVVDDASTDETQEVIAALARPDLRVVRLPQNSGAAAARNAGIDVARGEFIAFLDADDEWLPEKLSVQIAVIASRPEMSLIASQARFVTVDGVEEDSVYLNSVPARGAEAWRVLLAYNYIATPTVVARRSTLQAIGGFKPALIIGEDQDLWIRLSLVGEVGFIDRSLTIVYEQPNSLSRRTMLLTLEVMLPLVRHHYEAQKHRLTKREARTILGHRYEKLGRITYLDFPYRGAPLLLKAVWLRHHPWENLTYVVMASPPIRWLKRHILGRPA